MKKTTYSFIGQVTVVVLAVLLVAFFVRYAHLVLLVFAGALFAILIDGVAGFIQRRLSLGRRASLLIIYLVFMLLIVGSVFLLGPSIIYQARVLQEELPDALAGLREIAEKTRLGKSLLMGLPDSGEFWTLDFDKIRKYLGIFYGALGVLGSMLLVFILGIYLSINPWVYFNALVHLVPKGRRMRTRQVLSVLGSGLRRWLAGRFLSMASIWILTTVGLFILQVPMANLLGLFSGILTFIPIIGSIISAIPAILFGLLRSPMHALYVVLLYILVHFFEGYFIIPYIEQRVVSLPASMLIIAQLTMSYLFGFWGIILATPITLVIVILVEMLYVEDVIGDTIQVIGRKGERGSRAS